MAKKRKKNKNKNIKKRLMKHHLLNPENVDRAVEKMEWIMNNSDIGVSTIPESIMSEIKDALSKEFKLKDLKKQMLKEARIFYPAIVDRLGDTVEVKRAFCLMIGGMCGMQASRQLFQGASYEDSYFKGQDISTVIAHISHFMSNKLRTDFFNSSFSFNDLDQWFDRNIKGNLDRTFEDDRNMLLEKLDEVLNNNKLPIGLHLDNDQFQKMETIIDEYTPLGQTIDYIMKKARNLHNDIKDQFENGSKFRNAFSLVMGEIMAQFTYHQFEILIESDNDKNNLSSFDQTEFSQMAGVYLKDLFLMEFFKAA